MCHMKKQDNPIDQALVVTPEQALRQRAELQAQQIIAEKSEIAIPKTHNEVLGTLHELHVHQIELELQNQELRCAQLALEETQARYFNLYDMAPVGYITLSEAGIITQANLTASILLGLARGILVGKPISSIISKGDQNNYYLHRKKLFETGEPQQCDLRMKKNDGTTFWANITTTLQLDSFGACVNRMVLNDVTLRKQAEDALHESEERYKGLFENSGVGIAYYTPEGIVISYNKKALENMGGKLEDYVGKSMDAIFPKELATLFMRRIKDAIVSNTPQEYEDCLTFHAVTKWFSSTFTKIANAEGEITGVQIISFDITRRKVAEQELVHLSYHDQLSGLYNRRFFEEELKRLDTERNLPLTLIMADVNGLKMINDSFGHMAGDELLKKVSSILKNGCRADDIVARLGGDEFIVILPKTDGLGAAQLIERLEKVITNQPFDQLSVSLSFGYATKSEKSMNIQQVFIKSENNMYQHKVTQRASMHSKTIDMVLNALYEKSSRESLHSTRVSTLSEAIATVMHLNIDEIMRVKTAGLLHDIGKIGISESILNKPHCLNKEEWVEMQKHSEIGWRILISSSEFAELAVFVLQHHEHWDGQGYPEGLKGNDISTEARIITLADSYDAMTGVRLYQKSLTKTEAIKEIQKCAGKQFDPEIAKVFVEQVLMKNDVCI